MTAPTNTTVERWAVHFKMDSLIRTLIRLNLWNRPTDDEGSSK